MKRETNKKGPPDPDYGNGRSMQPIRGCIRESLKIYFDDLDGHKPAKIYEMVISQVEQPLLEVVMKHTGSNITRAADILGINRATLRRKLKKYGLMQ